MSDHEPVVAPAETTQTPARAVGRRLSGRLIAAVTAGAVVLVGAATAIAVVRGDDDPSPSAVVRAMVEALSVGDCERFWEVTDEDFRAGDVPLATCDDFEIYRTNGGRRHPELTVEITSEKYPETHISEDEWSAVVLATLHGVMLTGEEFTSYVRYWVVRDRLADNVWRVHEVTAAEPSEEPVAEPTVEPEPPTSGPAPPVPEPTTTDHEQVLVAPDGGIDSFDRGAPADDVIDYLTERLGEPTLVSADSGCGPAAIPGQTLRWGGLDVAFFTVDEVDLTTPAPAYLASWTLREPAGDVRATTGLAPGDTVGQLRAAHPEMTGEEWLAPTAWLWSDGTWSSESMMVVTTGGQDTDTISHMSGGYQCGE